MNSPLPAAARCLSVQWKSVVTALCAAALPLLLGSCADNRELLKRQATLNAQLKMEKSLRHPKEVARLQQELAVVNKQIAEDRRDNVGATLGFLVDYNEMMERRQQDNIAHLAGQGSGHVAGAGVSAAASSATHNAAPIVGHAH